MTGSKSPRESGARRAESLERVSPSAQSLSCVQLFATPWTLTHQALLSMGFPRQEYWSGFPFPFPGDFLDLRIQLVSLVFPALTGGFFSTVPPGTPALNHTTRKSTSRYLLKRKETYAHSKICM